MAALENLFGGLGGFIGDFFADEDRDKAEEYLAQATRAYEDIDPTIQADDETASTLGPSGFNNIRLDPATRTAQLQVLHELVQNGMSGGLSPQDRARMAEI